MANHLLGAGEHYHSVGKSYTVFQSWSHESTGPAVQDTYDEQLPVTISGTAEYTITFPSDKRPAEILDCTASFSVAGYDLVKGAYDPTDGTLVVTVYSDANGDGTYAAAVEDELVIRVQILCVK